MTTAQPGTSELDSAAFDLGLDMATYNVHDGFLEAVLRGFRGGLLTPSDYVNLTQCDVLDNMKMHLACTDYGNFLQNEPSPLHTTTIAEKCTEKLVDEFHYLRAHSEAPLSQFLDYITYSYMIDNVILLITGTLHGRDVAELIEKCHPLGVFDTMGTLCVASSTDDLYRMVLVDTPLGDYFAKCIAVEDLDEMNIEIIRNTVYKAYLEDFLGFCHRMGGTTWLLMGDILKFEADRRCINITINSFGTEITKDQRTQLFPTMGFLAPEGQNMLARVDDIDGVRTAMEKFPMYRQIFSETGMGSDKSLEDAFYEREVKLNELTFDQQFNYALFYAYFRLKEQEIRNIVWIAECISQNQKGRIQQYIPIFAK